MNCFSQSRVIERKQKTNLAGGETDWAILIINKGLFCDRTARGVHTFISQL